MDHIDCMDQLREGIGLRAYGNRQPSWSISTRATTMFEEMVRLIQEDTLRRLHFAIITPAAGAQRGGQEHRDQRRSVRRQAAGEGRSEGGTERSLPLRKREKIQGMLRQERIT